MRRWIKDLESHDVHLSVSPTNVHVAVRRIVIGVIDLELVAATFPVEDRHPRGSSLLTPRLPSQMNMLYLTYSTMRGNEVWVPLADLRGWSMRPTVGRGMGFAATRKLN